MQCWPPLDLDSVPEATVRSIDTAAAEQAMEEARAAADLSELAIAQAFENEEKAREAQPRIAAHNREVSGKIFGKPTGWRNLGGGQYLGYTTRDADGDLVPHGEGEHWFPSGNYLCGEFEQQHLKGLAFWHFPDGSERAGVFDNRADAGHVVDRMSNGVLAAGEFSPGGMGFTLKLGLIAFPDGSRYRGFCGYSPDADYWVPSGFGIWDSGQALACLGFFENGLLSGECFLNANSVLIAAEAEEGRLIAKAAKFK